MREHSRSRRVLCCALAGIVLATLGGGCAYLGDRGRDFSDILSVGVSTGGGVLVGVKATRLLSLELGTRKDEKFYGWHRRHTRWMESGQGLWFAIFWSPTLGKEPHPPWTWTNLFKTSHIKKAVLEPAQRHPPDYTQYEERAYHLFVLTRREHADAIEELDIQVDASALIGGLQIILSPGQLFDFLAGIVTLDPAGDDGEELEEEAPPEEKKPPEEAGAAGETTG